MDYEKTHFLKTPKVKLFFLKHSKLLKLEKYTCAIFPSVFKSEYRLLIYISEC